MLETLFSRRLIVVTGKGGVGKTTLTAALALKAAESGHRVLCCEVATIPRLSPLFGVEVSEAAPTKVPGLVDAGPHAGLFLLSVQSESAMREYALMKLKFQAVYRAVFENRLVRAFLRMIPSLAETVVLGKVWFEVQAKDSKGAPRWDLVILDAPATGHGVSFLRVPQTLMETLPPGSMRDDAEKMHATLIDPEMTQLVIVTLPEETPVLESIELCAQLRDSLGMTVSGIALNACVPSIFDPSTIQRFEQACATQEAQDLPPLEEKTAATAELLKAVAQTCLTQVTRARRTLALRERLHSSLPELPIRSLPELPSSQIDLAALRTLGDAWADRSGSGP